MRREQDRNEDTVIVNSVIVNNIMELHGMRPFDTYTEEECASPAVPAHVPEHATVMAVRDCFKAATVDPSLCGGYIDFLESAFIPADPNDEVCVCVCV